LTLSASSLLTLGIATVQQRIAQHREPVELAHAFLCLCHSPLLLDGDFPYIYLDFI
jgi:hypothetical protein